MMSLFSSSTSSDALFLGLTERDLIWWFCVANTLYVVLGTAILVYVGQPAIYGRYSNAKKDAGILRIPFEPKTFWILAEAPNLITGTVMLVRVAHTLDANDPRFVIPSLFMLHYVFRMNYALNLKGGSSGPLSFLLLCMIFTLINGVVQTRWHTAYETYERYHMNTPRSLLGLGVFFFRNVDQSSFGSYSTKFAKIAF